jgi:hypothetical protein
MALDPTQNSVQGDQNAQEIDPPGLSPVFILPA